MQMTTPPNLLQHLWKASLGAGIVSVILGVIVLAWPGKTILVAAVFVGAYLLVTGVIQVVLALSLNVSWSMRLLPLISGVAAVALAVLCFLSLQNSMLLLAIWIGVGFIFRGVATAISAFGDPTLPGRAWEIFVGVISLVAGVVVLASPLQSLATLTLVVAIWLVVVGGFEVISAFGIRAASSSKPAVDPSPTEEPDSAPEPKETPETVTNSPASEEDASERQT